MYEAMHMGMTWFGLPYFSNDKVFKNTKFNLQLFYDDIDIGMLL
jgi:hypothetical protein